MPHREKFGLIPWSRFVVGTSAALGSAWERHWSSGFPVNGGYSRLVTTEPPPNSWGIEYKARERQDPDSPATSPCLLEISLKYNLSVVTQVEWRWDQPISSAGENILKYTDKVLADWADLLRKHCLDLDHL